MVGTPAGRMVSTRSAASANSASSASARPFRFGERWWPEGESDAAALRGRGWYALYIAAIVAVAALLLLRAPPPCTSTLAAAATSELVAPWVLLLFRGAACALVLGVVVSLWRKEAVVTLETVDRRDVSQSVISTHQPTEHMIRIYTLGLT